MTSTDRRCESGRWQQQIEEDGFSILLNSSIGISSIDSASAIPDALGIVAKLLTGVHTALSPTV